MSSNEIVRIIVISLHAVIEDNCNSHPMLMLSLVYLERKILLYMY